MMRSLASAAVLLAATGMTTAAMAQTPPAPASATAPLANPPIPEGGFATSDATDPYLWLEEVDGARAMEWVRAHNERSLGVLQGDPRYEPLHQAALAIVQSRDRIPGPGFNHDGTITNFWQDAEHVRGVWRKTTLDSYRTEAPQWETVLDFDALAASEGKNWVYKGASCLPPDERLCLISLSDGGKDAVVVREFDSVTKTFVDGGFSLPESKGGVSWVDADTLLIARDFGPGTMTTSGYPMVLKRLKRGQTLDQAETIFTGQPSDVSVGGSALRDADGVIQAVLINRGISFYESETWRLNADGSTTKLELPAKSDIDALVQGQLIVTTKQDWTAPSGQTFLTGDVIAWNLDAWLADPKTEAKLVIRPTERQSVEGITATRNKLVVALFDNVRGGVHVYDPKDWSHTVSTCRRTSRSASVRPAIPMTGSSSASPDT
jgi:prolyl oligopeptidase